MKLSLKKWYRILAPRPVVLVSTVNNKGVSNAAPFSFVMPVSSSPPLIAFASHPGHETVKNILKIGDFTVNIPSLDILRELWICADDIPEGVSEIKKIAFGNNHNVQFSQWYTLYTFLYRKIAKLTEEKSTKIKSPKIKECFARYKCKLAGRYKTGDHLLIVGEVLYADIRDDLMKGKEFEIAKANPLMHIGGEDFGLLGKIVKAR